MRRQTILAGAAILALVGLATSARAGGDGPLVLEFSPTQYSYKLTLLPDIDQRREDLPNDGQMYCVPTSVLNLCAYAGNHGFAGDVQCGDLAMLYYAFPLWYDEVTVLNSTMGFTMGTDPEDGTTMNGGLAGSQWAMGGGFLTMAMSRGNGSWPNFDQIAGFAKIGALVSVVVGWYDAEGNASRDGGHAMSLAYLFRWNDERVLGVHDPASDENPNNLDAQSMFTREDYQISREVRIIDGAPALVDRLVGLGGNGTVGIIDGFFLFLPSHAYHWGGKPGLIEGFTPGGWSAAPDIDVTLASVIRDLDMDPSDGSILVLQDDTLGGSQLSIIESDSGEETLLLGQVDVDAFEVSRSSRLYTLSSNSLLTCHRIRGTTLPVESQAQTPVPIDAIVFDDAADQLVGVAGPLGTVYVWEQQLAGEPESFDLGFEITGEVYVTISPVDGRVWVTSDVSELLYGLDRGTGEVDIIEHPAIKDVQSFSITPEGNLLVGDGVTATCISPEGAIVPDSPWLSVGRGPLFFPTTSTNFNPDTMTGPGWHHEPPLTFGPSIPVCLADINGDDTVSLADLLAVLASWDSDSLATDLTLDGHVDFGDLIIVLGAWGPCP